jgi:hypothetical protein
MTLTLISWYILKDAATGSIMNAYSRQGPTPDVSILKEFVKFS